MTSNHIITGCWMRNGGYIDDLSEKRLHVQVTNGVAYTIDYLGQLDERLTIAQSEFGAMIYSGTYIGEFFSPDEGELERIGLVAAD